MIGEWPHHHELALALVAPANVFGHVDVPIARQLGPLSKKGRAVGSVHAVWRSLHQDGQRRLDVCRLEESQRGA